MVGNPSLSQTYLSIQLPFQSTPKICSSTSVNFYVHISLLFVHKIILKIPTNTLLPYTSAIFHLPIFCAQPSQQSTPKIFSLPQLFSQFRLHKRIKGLGSLLRTGTVLISPFFLKIWKLITGLTTTHSLSLRLRKLGHCR